MPQLSDWLKSINATKENLMDSDSIASSDYNAYIMTMAFSMYPDTLHIAEILNQMPNIPVEMHYRFLLEAVPAKKSGRYAEWPKKKVDTEEVKCVSMYYGINLDQAKEYISLMKPEDVKAIVAIYNDPNSKKK